MQIFLGDMELRPSEQPEFIQRGGGQHLGVFEFPGGNVAVQNFGPRYRQVSWHGWFEGLDAYERMIRIGNMRQKGDPITLKTDKTNQNYVIAGFYPDYKSDTYIPFTITLQPIINLTPKNVDPIDRIIAEIEEDRKNGGSGFIFRPPARIGGETYFQLLIDTNDGAITNLFYGFMYTPRGDVLTAYARDGLSLLRWIECEVETPYRDGYYKVCRNGKEATISILTEGDYRKSDCIRLEDLKALGIGVDYASSNS